MPKTIKISVALCLVLCLSIGIAMFLVACNGDEPTKLDYSVTVTGDLSGLELAALEVKLLNSDGSNAAGPQNLTGGKATFNLNSGTYKVAFDNLNESLYRFDETYVTPENRDVTVEITEIPPEDIGPDNVTFTVKVVLPDGNLNDDSNLGTPVPNVLVQICRTGNEGDCSIPALTNSEGVATFERPEYDHQVHILVTDQYPLPPGCAFDNTRWIVRADDPNIVVTLESSAQYTISAAYGVFEDGYGVTHPAGDAASNVTLRVTTANLSDGNGNALTLASDPAPMTTDENGQATFTAFDHDYYITLVDSQFNLQGGPVYVPRGTHSASITLVRSGVPASFSDQTSGFRNLRNVTVGTYTVSLDPELGWHEFYFRFLPGDRGGYYRIYTTGELDTYLRQYSGTESYINSSAIQGDADDNGADKNFSYEFLIKPSELAGGGSTGNVYAFVIGANYTLYPGAEPASFELTIEFVRTFAEPTNVTQYPDAEEISDPPYEFAAPQNTEFTWLNYTDTVVYNSQDKFYHVGSADGPIVLANFIRVNPGQDANLMSAIEQGLDSSITWSDGVVNQNNEIISYNCTKFINQYAEAANSDGEYPLTEELAKFLQQYCRINGVWNFKLGWPQNSNQLFLFDCGYYKTKYDLFGGGAGTEDDAYMLGSYGTYLVNIEADSSVYLLTGRVGGQIEFDNDSVTMFYNSDSYASGSATVTGGANFRFQNNSAQAVALEFSFSPARGSENNPIPINMGNQSSFTENVVISEDEISDGLFYSLTLSETKLITISTTDDRAVIASPTNLFDPIMGAGSVTLEIVQGRTYLFVFGATDPTDEAGYDVRFETTAYNTPSGNGTAESPYAITDEGWYLVELSSANDFIQYFAFNARIAGEWQLVLSDPDANVNVLGDSVLNEGTTYTMGEFDAQLVIRISVGELETGLRYFEMGRSDIQSQAPISYFFRFETAPISTQPSVGDDIWSSGVEDEFFDQGGTAEFGTPAPEISLDELWGTHTVALREQPQWFKFVATEDMTITITSVGHADVGIGCVAEFDWGPMFVSFYPSGNSGETKDFGDTHLQEADKVVTLTAKAGETYYLYVGDDDLAGGDVTFTIERA